MTKKAFWATWRLRKDDKSVKFIFFGSILCLARIGSALKVFETRFLKTTKRETFEICSFSIAVCCTWGTGRRFFIMFTIASILHLGFMSLKTLSPEIHETARPVASTLCMGLYQAFVRSWRLSALWDTPTICGWQEAFRWDEVTQKMNFYDGFGRVILIIGTGMHGVWAEF